jgi:hypothetical protein
VVGELHARLVHEDIVPLLLEVPWYLEGIAGAFEAGYAFLGLEGEVGLELDVAQRSAQYDIRWVAKAPALQRP